MAVGLDFILSMVTAAAAAGGAYAAVRVEVRMIWRQLSAIEAQIGRAHARIDGLVKESR